MKKIILSFIASAVFISSPAFSMDKKLFIDITSIPIINAVKNQNKIRRALENIKELKISKSNIDFIDFLSNKYNVNAEDNDQKLYELLSKIDHVPASFLVARSALSSGWGRTPSFKRGNIYSQFCNGKLCSFENNEDAASSIIHEISVSEIWKDFRAARRQLRDDNDVITGEAILLKLMKDISVRDKQFYSKMNDIVIKENLDNNVEAKLKKIKPLKSKTVLSGLNQMSIGERKKIFITTLVPIVHSLNREFVYSKKELIRIKSDIDKNIPISLIDKSFVKKMGSVYEIPRNLPFYQIIEVLLQKIDIIPPSLIVGHAAFTTGWGTNKMFADKSNPFSYSCGINLCNYNSLETAIFEHMLNMNKEPKFSLFRSIRKMVLQSSKPLSGWVMAQGLIHNGGQDGLNSTRSIQSIIDNEGMDEEYTTYPVDSEVYTPLYSIFTEESYIPNNIILSR